MSGSGWFIGNGSGKAGTKIASLVYTATGSKFLGVVAGILFGLLVGISFAALVFWLVLRNERF